jgi:hypothetical protein
LGVFFGFLVGHVTAYDTASRCAKYGVTAANKVAAHAPDSGTF